MLQGLIDEVYGRFTNIVAGRARCTVDLRNPDDDAINPYTPIPTRYASPELPRIANAVMFEHCGILYLYSLGSAAAGDWPSRRSGNMTFSSALRYGSR